MVELTGAHIRAYEQRIRGPAQALALSREGFLTRTAQRFSLWLAMRTIMNTSETTLENQPPPELPVVELAVGDELNKH